MVVGSTFVLLFLRLERSTGVLYSVYLLKMSSEEAKVNSEQPIKKRKLYGRLSDVNKKIRLQSHESSQNC